VTRLTIGPYIDTPKLALMQLPPRGLLEFLFVPTAAFDQSLLGLQLPFTLHTLHFGMNFNHSLDGVELPSSLTDLYLGVGVGSLFNQPVETLCLPASLRKLRFAHRFNQPMEQLALPPALEYLHMGGSFNQPLVRWQPPTSLRTLVLGKGWNLPASQLRLPSHLTDLDIGQCFRHPLREVMWPPSLTRLKLGWIDQPLDREHWTPPPHLRSLQIDGKQAIRKLHLPSSLTRLYLSQPLGGMHELEFAWPPQLEYLLLRVKARSDECFAAVIDVPLPASMKELEIRGIEFSMWSTFPVPPGCTIRAQ